MTKDTLGSDVVVDFWTWYRRREAHRSPLANYALDKCEEAFRKCQWNSFSYWYAIYRRERPKTPCFSPKLNGDYHRS